MTARDAHCCCYCQRPLALEVPVCDVCLANLVRQNGQLKTDLYNARLLARTHQARLTTVAAAAWHAVYGQANDKWETPEGAIAQLIADRDRWRAKAKETHV